MCDRVTAVPHSLLQARSYSGPHRFLYGLESELLSWNQKETFVTAHFFFFFLKLKIHRAQEPRAVL